MAGICVALPADGIIAALQASDDFTVSSVKGNPGAGVRKAVELLGGMGRFVKKGQAVVIKPNIGFPVPPEMGATVSPEVVAETARMCVEAGAERIYILENPLRTPEVCLKISGIYDACRKIERTNLFGVTDKSQFQAMDVPKGIELKKTSVMKDILKKDTVIINIATAKSHGATTVSLCLKNLMGTILDRKTFHRDMNIHQAIADLATIVKCDLNIIDATRAMVTGGPAGPGRLEMPGTILAGSNIVCVDAVGVTIAKWYGKSYSPQDIKHIVLAEKHGLGPADLKKIKIIEAKV